MINLNPSQTERAFALMGWLPGLWAYDPKSVSWTDDIVLPDGSLNFYARVHGG